MVDLPQINNVQLEVRAPQTRVSPAQIASPYEQLAANAEKLAGVLDKDVAQPLAERAGRESVTLDEKGMPVVSQSPFPIVGDSAERFARAARTTALAQAEPAIEEAGTRMRLAHPGDPAGMKAAGQEYVKELVGRQTDPVLKSALQTSASRVMGANLRSSLVEADALNRKNLVDSATSRISDLNDKAIVLAAQPGGTGTPEYAQTVADRAGLYKELQGDPRIGYTPERIAREVKQQTDLEKGYAIVGETVREYQTKKNAVEAKRQLMDAMWGPGAEKLNLTEQQRNHIVATGISRLERATGEDAAERTEFNATVGEYIRTLRTNPNAFNPVAHSALVEQARAAGNTKALGDLEAARIIAPLWSGLKGLSTDQQIAALRDLEQFTVPKTQGTLPGMMGEEPGGLRAGQVVTGVPAVQRLFIGTTLEMQAHLGKEVDRMATDMHDTLINRQQAVTPGELSTFVQAVRATGRTDLVDKVERDLATYDKARGVAEAGNSPSVAALQAQMKVAAASGVDPVARHTLNDLIDMTTKSAAAMDKSPLTEMATRGWIDPVNPLDINNLQNFAAELRERERKLGIGDTLEPGLGPKSVIESVEGKALAATLTQGPPQQAGQLLDAMSQVLSPETYRATMATPELKDALISMSRSSNPDRMTAGMSTLDRLWRDNAPQFKATYGTTTDRLLAWNGLKGAFTAPQIVERLNVADDPAQATAREKIADEVEKKELAGKTASDIAYKVGSFGQRLGNVLFGNSPTVSGVSGNELAARSLQAEWENVYKTLRTNGVDPDRADKLATEKIKADWGPSVVVGGAIMRNPPESYYERINGSYDWMTDALSSLITEIKGEPEHVEGMAAMTADVAKAANIARVQALVADQKTQAEIAAGKPPMYRIVLNDPSGNMDVLTDRDGNQRFGFDPKPHIKAFQEHYGTVEEMRRSLAAPGITSGF